MKHSRPRSLKWRLIRQLVLLQIITLVIFSIGYLVLMVELDTEIDAVSPMGLTDLLDEVRRDPTGRLYLPDTVDLEAIYDDAQEVWMIARNDRGQTIEVGQIPPYVATLRLQDGKIGAVAPGADPAARNILITQASTGLGRFTVIGPGLQMESSFYTTTLLLMVVLPWLAVLTILILLATPFLAARFFSVLKKITQEAEGIDLDRTEEVLGRAGVPKEVQPMIEAVNAALKRMDEGYQRQKRIILDTAHELRTPIAILQTRVETLEDSPIRSKLLTDAGRVSALTEQLLDIQRLSLVGVEQAPVDLVALSREVVADMAPLAIQQGNELQCTTEVPALTVLGDAGSLRRVLINLIQNALEHSGKTGIIAIRVGRDHSVEVADQGQGIPEDERDNIFEPFHRLQARDHGAGLGLNLVREILRKHGAEITVTDEPGGGACFRIQFRRP